MSHIDHSTALLHAFNDADWKTFKEIAGDLVYNEPATGRSLRGDDYIEGLKGWKLAFPDLTGEITNAFESDGNVTLEVVWTGTHDGPFMTPTGDAIPATGNPVSLMTALVHRYEGDEVVNTNHYLDLLTVLRAVGVA